MLSVLTNSFESLLKLTWRLIPSAPRLPAPTHDEMALEHERRKLKELRRQKTHKQYFHHQ